MTVYWGRSITPLILNLDAEWSTSSSGRFIPGKEPRYPFNRGLDGPRMRYGRFEKRDKCLDPTGIRIPDR